ncbi:hypothetical protein LNP74_05075 [Klebsiella pneumoniae subsp. pneumoniae]|nr:hypothetical protein [Klebsiella pneumoniae subsp. pneumoniae]
MTPQAAGAFQLTALLRCGSFPSCSTGAVERCGAHIHPGGAGLILAIVMSFFPAPRTILAEARPRRRLSHRC